METIAEPHYHKFGFKENSPLAQGQHIFYVIKAQSADGFLPPLGS